MFLLHSLPSQKSTEPPPQNPFPLFMPFLFPPSPCSSTPLTAPTTFRAYFRPQDHLFAPCPIRYSKQEKNSFQKTQRAHWNLCAPCLIPPLHSPGALSWMEVGALARSKLSFFSSRLESPLFVFLFIIVNICTWRSSSEPLPRLFRKQRCGSRHFGDKSHVTNCKMISDSRILKSMVELSP